MKNFLRKYKIAHLVAAFFVFMPVFLFAASVIENPLKSNDVKVILKDIMDMVAMVGGVIVVLFIIYSGFKFVTAQGNESEVTKAKDMFYATVIGGAILLGADVIANVVVNTVETTTGVKFTK